MGTWGRCDPLDPSGYPAVAHLCEVGPGAAQLLPTHPLQVQLFFLPTVLKQEAVGATENLAGEL